MSKIEVPNIDIEKDIKSVDEIKSAHVAKNLMNESSVFDVRLGRAYQVRAQKIREEDQKLLREEMDKLQLLQSQGYSGDALKEVKKNIEILEQGEVDPNSSEFEELWKKRVKDDVVSEGGLNNIKEDFEENPIAPRVKKNNFLGLWGSLKSFFKKSVVKKFNEVKIRNVVDEGFEVKSVELPVDNSQSEELKKIQEIFEQAHSEKSIDANVFSEAVGGQNVDGRSGVIENPIKELGISEDFDPKKRVIVSGKLNDVSHSEDDYRGYFASSAEELGKRVFGEAIKNRENPEVANEIQKERNDVLAERERKYKESQKPSVWDKINNFLGFGE